MNEGTIEIKVYVSTNFVGSEDSTILVFDREDWNSMTWHEKNEACIEAMFEMID